MTIIKFNLHVDDVGHALVRHLNHLQFVPDASPDRDPIGDPGHVHSLRAYNTSFLLSGKLLSAEERAPRQVFGHFLRENL
jgi:hypothetical protein